MNEELLIANMTERSWGKRCGPGYTFDLMVGGRQNGWQLIIGFRIFQGAIQAPARKVKGTDYFPTLYFNTAMAGRIYRAVKEQCPAVKLAHEYRTLAELSRVSRAPYRCRNWLAKLKGHSRAGLTISSGTHHCFSNTSVPATGFPSAFTPFTVERMVLPSFDTTT